MKSSIAYGFATLVGVMTSAIAIEPPGAAAPIPPQLPPKEAATDMLKAAGKGPNKDVPARAYLGVGTSEVPNLLGEHLGLESGEGVVVRALDPLGPAAKAGVSQKDVIIKVAGSAIGSHEELRQLISGLTPGEEADVEYIHRGETVHAKLTLGEAPALPPELAEGNPKPLEQLSLDGMPQEQTRRIREAIEQNIRQFEGLQNGNGAFPGELLGSRMHEKIQEMMENMDLPDDENMGIHQRSSGTIRMLDSDGSGVELRTEDGKKKVRLLGRGGEVQWEGPYDTAEDREAVPEQFKERISQLNIDTDFKGSGLRLRMRSHPPLQLEE